MSEKRRRRRSPGAIDRADDRAVSTVVGVALLLLIVLLMAVTAGSMFVDLGQSELSTVHDQGMFEGDITQKGERAVIESRAVKEHSEEVDFVLEVNGEEVRRWDGRDDVEIECLYPGDHVQLFSKGPDQTFLIDEYYFDRATECSRYRTFPEKFEHVIVDGTERSVNDRYAFGLSVVPNGDGVATDPTGDNDANLGNISMTNEWHHVEQYDEPVEGLEPPVFVIVLVDNVHWEEAPDPGSHSEVDADEYYNWTDSPPTGLATGEDSYEVVDGNLSTDSGAGTEPTNDIFLVFKPGCEESTLLLADVNAGYDNEVYMNDERIIDDTSTAPTPHEFTAPGVECNGPAEW